MGDPIPEAELLRADFTAVPLARLGGSRPVLLVFLSAGCPPCREAAVLLEDWAQTIAPVQLRVAATATPQELGDELAAAVPFALHAAQSARRVFGVRGTPSAVLLGGAAQPAVASPVVEGAADAPGLSALHPVRALSGFGARTIDFS